LPGLLLIGDEVGVSSNLPTALFREKGVTRAGRERETSQTIRLVKNATRPMPPTTPPAMAPAFVDDFNDVGVGGGGSIGWLVGELVPSADLVP
jgi:hypothetical protein